MPDNKNWKILVKHKNIDSKIKITSGTIIINDKSQVNLLE